MSSEGCGIYEPQTLDPLVELSDVLSFTETGKVKAEHRLPSILDEHGVPMRVEMVKAALGTIAAEHYWDGPNDLHHLAYERRTYRNIVGNKGELIGSNYRGAATQKVRLPRQLHNYMHLIFETPPVPSLEVMRHYGHDASIAHNLFNAVKITSYKKFPELEALPFERKEELRASQLGRKLENIEPSPLGYLCDIEELSKLGIAEARAVLRGLARAQGYSNHRNQKKGFLGTSVEIPKVS